MRIGVFDHLDRSDLPLPAYFEARLQIVEAYDKAGFYSYHLAEHHATPLGMAPSPSVFLAAVAQRTKRLRFGPMVYALPLYHPLRLAEEICMLDQMSNGRLDIGFGRGASPIELACFGEEPEQAQSIYDEALEVIIKCLTQPTVDHAGKHFQFRDVPIVMDTHQKPYPPVWYGAHAPESAERAARRGLHIISLDPSELASTIIHRYREVWRAMHGEALALPNLGIGRFIVVADTDGEALALARSAYARWYASFNWLFNLRKREIPRHARPPTFDALMERGQGVAGSAATVARWLNLDLTTTSANYLVGQFAFGNMPVESVFRSLDLFTREVAPQLPAGR
ncbi:MAG: LLM class flavin-dependent oxidoreductase [Burkholderiales bacterium]